MRRLVPCLARTYALVLTITLSFVPVPGFAQPFSPAARDAAAKLNVLVTMKPGADRGPVRALAARHGAKVRYEYRNVMTDTLNVRGLPAAALAALRDAQGVLSVMEDVYHDDLLQLDESIPLIHGLQTQISGAGFAADGAGTRICVIDTGVAMTHIMYADHIDTAASYDFVNDDPLPQDDQGHGSHVAGTALGRTGLVVDLGCEGRETFQGVAPNATLIAMKVLDATGGGLDSDVVAALDRCVDPALPGGPADVINLSLGGGSFTGPCDGLDPMADAANDAVIAGAVVVAAAGNEGNDGAIVSPACGSRVIAVAATYKDAYPNCENPMATWSWCFDFFCFDFCSDPSPQADDLVCFSNRSDMIDVAAPGCSILSTDYSTDTAVSEKCGTSMAAPHVAGLAALLVQAQPGITPVEVRRAIRDGAVDRGPTGFDDGYGYGRIDALGSLAALTPCTNAADCADEAFCNGVEQCTSGVCSSGSDPCPGQRCDEGADECYTLGCNRDGVCGAREDCTSCPDDCAMSPGASCGNGVCEAGDGEDCLSCPADCAGKQDGLRKQRFCCGDGDGVKPVGCADSRCGLCTDTAVPTSCCGDGACTAGAEGSDTCAVDCGPPPVCGDGVCHADENGCDCPADCPRPIEICGNGIDDNCDGATDCADAQCIFSGLCSCMPNGFPCTYGADCCSGKCAGGSIAKTCR
jgi:subtilisin family serine protease